MSLLIDLAGGVSRRSAPYGRFESDPDRLAVLAIGLDVAALIAENV